MLALKIKELRKLKGMTQKQFCEEVDISPRALSNYENGTTDISLKKLHEVALHFSLTIFDLVDFEGKSKIYSTNEEISGFLRVSEEHLQSLEDKIKLLEENRDLYKEQCEILKNKLSLLESKLKDLEQ